MIPELTEHQPQEDPVYDLLQVQENVKRVLSEIAFGERPHLSSVLFEDVELTAAGPNNILHKLDREWRGWTLVRKQGPGDVYEDTASTEDKTTTLALSTSADVTISLVIF